MIEPLIGVVAFTIFLIAICVIGCAMCYCIPLLLIALGFTWCKSRGGPTLNNGSYSHLSESEQGGHELVEAEAYISPPLVVEVQDGVEIIEEGSSVTGMSSIQYDKHSERSAYGVSTAGSAPLLEQGGQRPDISGYNIEDASTHTIEVRGFIDCGRFKDTLAAMVFIINVIIIFSIAVQAIALFAEIGKSNISKDQIPSGTLEAFNDDLPGVILAFGTVAFFATVITSMVYLTLLMKYSAQMIVATIWGSIAVFTVASITAALNGAFVPSILCALFAGLAYWWLKASESRIAFASVILKTAVAAVKDNFCQLMSVSLFLQCLQLVYMLAWLVAFVYFMIIQYHGVHEDNVAAVSSHHSDGEQLMSITRRLSIIADSAHQLHYNKKVHHSSAYSSSSYAEDYDDNKGEGGSGLSGFIIFLYLLSLYWGAQVCRNILSSTVSGTLACWWFSPRRKAIVAGALFRSCTVSFGSICLGSLLVSLVQAFKATLEKTRDAARRRREARGPTAILASVFLGIMSCLLNAIESILEYMNRYALVYCAAYGTNFLTSGARVWALFKKRGWSQIINDNLIGNCLSLGVFATSCLTAIFAYLCSFFFTQDLAKGGIEKPRLIMSAGGFVLGIIVSLLVSNMIESAVASLFVFFAEDPKELQRNHPTIHDELCEAWLVAHPASLNYYNGALRSSAHSGAKVVHAHAVSDITGTASAPMAPLNIVS